jgi:hypothetical protein
MVTGEGYCRGLKERAIGEGNWRGKRRELEERVKGEFYKKG